MNIQDALKETGKAKMDNWSTGAYLYYKEITLCLNYALNQGEKTNYNIPYHELYSESWQPYHPEPKCPACINADKLSVSSFMSDAHLAVHLRKYHCTCKES